MRRVPALAGATLLVLLVPHPGRASCPTITIGTALKEGDPVAGSGLVTRIDNLAVNNSGQWIVEADTDFATTTQDQVLVKSGVLYLREDDPVPPGAARISSFDSVNLNNDGNSGWNFFLRNTSGINDDSGIYFNTTLVIQESNVSTAPQFSPGTRYIGFFDAKINTNNNNQIMLIASIEDTAIATTVDRAVVILSLDGSGTLLSETVIAKEADFLPGQPEAVADFGTGPHESAFNDSGDVLYFGDLTGDTAKDGVIYKNLTLLAQEASPSPVAGRNYEILSSRGMDLGNSGDWVFKANLDGVTTDDDVLIRNNAVFMREGQSLTAIAPFTLTTFGTASGPVQIDDSGNVLWFGTWNDPNTNIDSGLFLNDCLIVQEGVTTVGGILIDTIQSGQDAFAMSDDGDWIIFEAVLANGLEGAFLIEVAEPIPVVLAAFEAEAVDGAIEISWRTAQEENHLGFHLYRSEAPEGEYEAVRPQMFLPGDYFYRDLNAEPGLRTWYRLEAVDRAGGRQTFGPVSAELSVGGRWRLAQSTPNPLRKGQAAMIRFELASAGHARLRVFDVAGRLERVLVDETLSAGTHEATWNGLDEAGQWTAAGIHFYVLETTHAVLKEKLMIQP